jgi:PKHD-type hydroxylase
LVKQNEQAAKQPILEPLKAMIQEALGRNSLFQAMAWPRTVHSILFSRYGVGMSYGRHTDNALMGGASLLRSDLSFTVFLSEPETYEGGELVIEEADSERPYKLAAGSALVYPSTTLHRVETVVKGDRTVAVGWVQSLVRQAAQREILGTDYTPSPPSRSLQNKNLSRSHGFGGHGVENAVCNRNQVEEIVGLAGLADGIDPHP